MKLISTCIIFSCILSAVFAQEDPKLALLVSKAMGSGKIPALAVLVLDSGAVAYRYEGGLVKTGSTEALAPGARFHIGSNTKAMTALIAGMLVDEGKLRWDSTIGEVLAGKAEFKPEYAPVTLAMLLAHCAGLPSGLPQASWATFFGSAEPISSERKRMAEASLALNPLAAPGKAYGYSNLGYVVAGFMMETVTGRDWESLLRDRLFTPLGMSGAGFGPPAASSGASAVLPGMPWGHNPKPINPVSVEADNPAALGPAGTAHAGLDDLAAYAQLYFSGGLAPDGTRLIKKETLDTILRPVLSNYSLGWGSIAWPKGETVLVHDGSNTMFYCSFVIVPEKKLAVFVLANSGTQQAAKAVFSLRESLVGRYSGY